MYRHYYESVNGGEPACIDEEIPFDIPDSWEWVRCSNLISLTSGQDLTPDKYNDKKKGIPYITGASNFNCGHVIINRWTQFPKAFAEQGNILLTCKGTIGELALLKEAQVHIARQVMAIQPIVSSLCDFLLLILEVNVQRFKTEAQSMIPGISRDVVLEALIPLPPTLEQHRMISKLKGLLPEIEKYGLKTTTLNKINSDFPVSLKKSILQHAIQGKLVPQDPNEEPASVLLERIAIERAKMGKKAAKSMSRIERRDRGTFLISPEGNETDITEEIPFEIPETWAWAKLGEIGQWGAGATPSRSHPEYYQGDIPWLKTGDLTDGYITSIPESISDLALEKTSVKLNPEGSILMAMYGATIGKLGILTFPATTNQACCACVPFSGIFNLYVFYYLMAQRTSFIKQGEGGAQPNISKEKIVNSFIAIPPTREQERIVEALSKTFSIMQA
ncbi:MAG: restriction endonuclease subunit S [Akkermansia sp.]|nr:restriction endonuclease subunit S [Akkermansia sp.]